MSDDMEISVEHKLLSTIKNYSNSKIFQLCRNIVGVS